MEAEMMIPTDKFLEMSEAASSFFEDCEFKEGDMYGARNHTCDNERFWKNTIHAHGKRNWKSIMLAESGEVTYGITDDSDDPNTLLACGHQEYETVFHLFRPCELLDMLNGFTDGYFTETEMWNTKEPLETIARIAHASITKKEYFDQFKSTEEFMLAFYMLEARWVKWSEPANMWL